MSKTRSTVRTAHLLLPVCMIVAPEAASAVPRALNCVLTDIEIKSPGAKFDSQVGAENRAIIVVFDDDAKTIALKQDEGETQLHNVAISQTSMTAAGTNISIGIDRSSWRVIFQTYAPGTARNEFGECTFSR